MHGLGENRKNEHPRCWITHVLKCHSLSCSGDRDMGHGRLVLSIQLIIIFLFALSVDYIRNHFSTPRFPRLF